MLNSLPSHPETKPAGPDHAHICSAISPGRVRPGGPRCETIQHLNSTLLALPRPLLERLTRACRKRFQVPDDAVTSADRINRKCPHDWIKAFLVQHQTCQQSG